MSRITFNVRKSVEACTFSVFLILIVGTNVAESRNIEKQHYREIMLPEAREVMIVQCRAQCINKFLLQTDNMITLPNCRENNNCAMCWDFCETLYVEERTIFKSMCTNHTCLKGCKHACRYYHYKNWLSTLTN